MKTLEEQRDDRATKLVALEGLCYENKDELLPICETYWKQSNASDALMFEEDGATELDPPLISGDEYTWGESIRWGEFCDSIRPVGGGQFFLACLRIWDITDLADAQIDATLHPVGIVFPDRNRVATKEEQLFVELILDDIQNWGGEILSKAGVVK